MSEQVANATEKSGPERLTSVGGPLGGETNKSPEGTSGATQSAGDARPRHQTVDDSNTPEDGAAATAAGDGDRGTHEDSSAKADSGVKLHSEQSENVNKMLDDAEKMVKEKGMTKEPEKEGRYDDGRDAVGEPLKDGGEQQDGEHADKHGLVDKLKAKVHKS